MKRIKTYLGFVALILIVFTACKPEEENDYQIVENFEIELSNSDYGTIAKEYLQNHTTVEDSAIADFIKNKKYFNDEIKAAEFVPYLLAKSYPHCDVTSSINVTYNVNHDLPEEFLKYTTAEEYELTDADYNTVSWDVGAAKYFFPNHPASRYLSGILSNSLDDPEDGTIYLVEYKEANSNPIVDTTQTDDEVIYMESFTNENDGLGTCIDVSIEGDQTWQWAQYGDGCAKMSGYAGSAVPNKDMLITQAVSLENVNDVKFSFEHAINYLGDGQITDLKVMITDDYDEAAPADSPWDELEIPNWPAGDSWSFFPSGDVDLTAYAGKTVRIAFYYQSNTENACTWEVNEIKIVTTGEASVTGDEPANIKTFYTFKDGNWEEMEDVYYLRDADYEAMGKPGRYHNFSSSALPEDYLPQFMNATYPLAGEGVSKTLVYKFYAGHTSLMATTYTKENGQWVSAYDYIEKNKGLFIVGEKQGEWVFDPTLRFMMTSDDYQIIVDYVKANINEDYLDSYQTGEFYTGANSHYGNFDLRINKRVENDVDNSFEGLSQEDASKLILNRLVEGLQILLQEKYPDSQPQVSGLDMHYIVGFKSYNNDFSKSVWQADLQCIEAGTPPKFELVNNTLTKDGETVVVE